MSKAKKYILPVLMIMAILTFNLGPATNVNAQPNSNQGIVVLTGDEAEEFVDATSLAVEEGEVENIAPVSSFDLEESTVYTVGGGVTVVSVPLHGDYSLPSNITVFFDDNNTVLQTNEMLVTKNEVENFQVETYLDGSLVKSEDTGLAWKTDEEMLAEKPVDPAEIQPMGVKAVAGCLAAVLGIGATAAYIVAVACGGSCAAPTPVTAVICAACIGAYAVIGGGAMTNAVKCFDRL